jgi:glucose/arabinose dehydrogenase
MAAVAVGGLVSALTMQLRGETPRCVDPHLFFEPWAEGIKEPTSMAWVTVPGEDLNGAGKADHVLLVLEKWTGNVRAFALAADGKSRPMKSAAIRLPVNFKSERGLLGIAVHPEFEKNRYVYLFHTQSDRPGPDGRSDVTRGQAVSRFTLVPQRGPNGELQSVQLQQRTDILNFPYEPRDSNGPNSCGGKILFGRDGKLYGVYGDQNRHGLETNENGGRIGAGVIFRVNDDGTTPADNPWAGHKDAVVRNYFAVGIRNCFGLAFDPQTKLLWDTENGDTLWDELNVVPPKFNSGSNYIMGPLWDSANAGKHRSDLPADAALGSKYGDPVFSWFRCRGLTCLAFLSTDRYGPAHKDTLLVAEVNGSWLMQFHLNKERDRVDVKSASLEGLVVKGDLPSEVQANQKEIMFATDAGTMTDMQIGPDGWMYMCSYRDGVVYVMKRR